ncbi:MAG: LysR family transcriptional regulator [Enterobacterales bacterium]|nr:LysR family transcriptional regulator [Enterobacterales bacterium]
MRLRHIEIFHAIYTTGSITSAARLLNVSQPSVSKVLAHAELQLGFKLFERVKGRLIATPEADMLITEADRIFNQMATISDLADNILHHRTGKIGIGTTMALGFVEIPQLIKQFHTQHPDVKIELQTLHNQNIANHLLRQQSDLTIMFAPRDIPDTRRYDFGKGKLVVVVPNHDDYPVDDTININALRQKPYISIRKSGPLGDLASEHIDSQLTDTKAVIQVDTYYVAIQIVKQGIGWCVIDEFTASANANDDVRILSLEEPIEYPIVGLCSDLQPVSTLISDFISHAEQHFLR